MRLGVDSNHAHLCSGRRQDDEKLWKGIDETAQKQQEQHKLNELIVVKLARQVDYLQTFVKEDSSI